ncbi:IST1-like protein, partial [Mucuna pruriens]
MLDGILGRGFAAKCKSLIKLTKSRIDVIRRKRRATEKFLKKDIVDLLHNGLDINAYGRAEGLVVELTLSSCYGFVEQCCEFVLKHLPAMQKLSTCPEECRMAVSSLMFAAARFSDLPELRDLRQIFQERYGNGMECYVNQEFAANLNFKSSTLENKVCLMQEIASEFSINWDSNAFKLRMSRSSAFVQDHNAGISNHDKPSHGKDFTQKEVRNDVLLERNQDLGNDRCRFQNGKEAVVVNRLDHDLQSKSTLPGNGFKPLNGREIPRKRDGHDHPGRQEVTVEKIDRSYWKEGIMLKPIGHPSQQKTVEQFEGGSKLHNSRGNTTPPRENQGSMLKPIGHPSQQKTVEQFEGGSKLYNSRGYTTPPRENQVSMLKPIGHPSQHKTVEQFEGGSKLHNSRANTTPLRENQGSMLKPIGRSSHKKTAEQFEGGSKLQDSWGHTTPLRENQDATPARKSPSRAGSRFKSNVNEPFAVNDVGLPGTDKSERKIQRDETPTLKPCYSNATPPPYVKQPNSKQKNSTREANMISTLTDSGGISTYHSAHDKPDSTSLSERIQIGLDSSDQDWQGNRHERLSKQSREKEIISIREDAEIVPLGKPRYMRRRHSRSRPPSYYDASNEDSGLERKSRSRSRRRDESRRGLKAMFDDERYQNAEEEMVIDKLLIHYSKKPSILVPEKLKRNTKTRHARLMDNSTRELLQSGSGDRSHETTEMVTLAPRSVSLPREQHREAEVKKVFTRAATFEPVRSHDARHVHPNLPDYDDLAARIAALGGR